MIKTTIAFIVVWLIVFTSLATFDYGTYSNVWGRVYAFWDKGAMAMLAYISWKPQPKQDMLLMKDVFWLLILRLIWDGISWMTGLSVNNPKAVGILFIIYSVYVLYKLTKKNA